VEPAAAHAAAVAPHRALWRWCDRNIFDLGRQLRLSYLPPLMVYLAAGVSGLTTIVGTFFVKEYLGLSAEFLAALAFWMMLPWTLKMPLGHVVDLIWRHKAGLVYLGAALVAASLLIMAGLLADPVAMRAIMPAEAWFVFSSLLAPIGYVLQDVVADAMTVEAVPRLDVHGNPVSAADRRLGHTTMQTLGRIAIIGGTVLVAATNVYMFSGSANMSTEQKATVYLDIYLLALAIPVISVLGTVFAGFLRRHHAKLLAAQGFDPSLIDRLVHGADEPPPVNWWILGGSLVFVAFCLAMGLKDVPFNQEIVFAGSLATVVFLMWRLVRELDSAARNVLVGTALVIFAFRAIPAPGPGVTWWQIDELGFDQQFLSELALIGSGLTLFVLFAFRRFVAEHSIIFIVLVLTLAGALLALPDLAMYYGFHEWTAAHTGGVVDARFIALINAAVESPLGQVAMIPMLAWIANSAPDRLKATFFAVMAAFTNLALSLSQLGTKYLNQVYVVTREVTDAATHTIEVPADYSQLGYLLITAIVVTLALPLLAIVVLKVTRLSSA
jgi:hypothetical protein